MSILVYRATLLRTHLKIHFRGETNRLLSEKSTSCWFFEMGSGEQCYSKAVREIILIVHNVRSCHNVGSLLRTADGLGIRKVILSGYTPYPATAQDDRFPHLSAKIAKRIHKTALGAEDSIPWEYTENFADARTMLKAAGFQIAAVEQAAHSVPLPDFVPPDKIALLVGSEVEGIEPEVLDNCDAVLEIPMFGQKESFNVAQAAAIALYHCRFA